MPSKELIEKFEKDNSVRIDSEFLSNTIERFLTSTDDNLEREAKIRQYVEDEYPKIAKEFERNKVRAIVTKHGYVSKSTALDLFEGYVNIVSEVIKDTYAGIVEKNKADREKAQAAINKATSERDLAQQKYDKAQEIKYEDVKKNYSNEAEFEEHRGKYKKALDHAKIALKNANATRKSIVDPEPYEGTMDYFGITEESAKKMLENQVGNFNYRGIRKTQIEETGVTNPAFMQELNLTFDDKVPYASASEKHKRMMQEVYITKELMQAQLNSHTGISGWFWRITHRAETKAMTNYVNAATQALEKAGFDGTAKTAAIQNMEIKGYSYGEYKSSNVESIIKEKFAKNEKAYADMKQEADRKEAEQKEAEAKEKAIPTEDQFFKINFRPAKSGKAFAAQANAFNAVAKIIKDNPDSIPEDVMHVFKATSEKMRVISRDYKKIGDFRNADMICNKVENELMTKISADTYKPMTFEEVKNSANQKQPMQVDLDEPNANHDVSQPVKEDSVKEKEQVLGNN